MKLCIRIAAVLVAVGIVACSRPPAPGQPGENRAGATTSPALGDLGKVGSVEISTSCSPAVRPSFERALALLHSFFYEEARRVFAEVAERDPGCAMAHWGIAMSWWHPIWTPPTADEHAAGLAAARRAMEIGGQTDLERGFLSAIHTFYTAAPGEAGGPAGQSCHGPIGGDHRARALAYEREMENLFARHAGEVEVATFYALALLGTAPPTDRSLKNQTRATEILERFWVTHRNHPGVAHYLIHGYDYPPIAHKGLAAARAYAEMAPWVPHVLHMPSHIFVRLGMWPEVIASNLASAAAARQYAALHHPDATSFEELHALDYLLYGYLQIADDASASSVVDRVLSVKKTHPEVDFVVAYAMGAIPARYTLERRRWSDAAALEVPDAVYWAKFPFARGHLEFATALGLARLGRKAEAQQAIERLDALAATTADPRFEYFRKHMLVQSRAVAAFVAAAEGKKDAAIRQLRAAADEDDALGKHPVSPGSILPVRELLADYLLEIGKPGEALAEYEACLELNPGRFNSLYGAGRAAELAGKPEVARRHYQALVAMAVPGARRPELEHARAHGQAR